MWIVYASFDMRGYFCIFLFYVMKYKNTCILYHNLGKWYSAATDFVLVALKLHIFEKFYKFLT